jgi:hypothetical protein
MPTPSGCPECDIIILSYGIIPGLCDTLRHRSLAIEEMYGITEVPPDVHAQIMVKQDAIRDMLKQANETQLEILQLLKAQPRK